VVDILTNVPMIRDDHNDQIYKTKNGKWKAVVNEITERHERASRSWWARSRSSLGDALG
jgi:preprotein translocase subunit SecA